MERHDRRIAAGLLIAATLATASARAQQTASASGASPWSFSVTPYFWAAALEGDVGVRGLGPAEIDASFGDIIENTDIALMLVAEARRNRWGLMLDVFYLGASEDAETPGPLFSGGSAEITSMFSTISAAYRVIEGKALSVDALGGGRIWYVDADLDLDAGLLPATDAQDEKSWVDPVVGLRANIDLGRGFFLTLLGDAGGFGVSSDSTWQALASIGYEVNSWFSLRAGYRHLEVDYDDDGFVYDVAISGPIFGLGFRF